MSDFLGGVNAQAEKLAADAAKLAAFGLTKFDKVAAEFEKAFAPSAGMKPAAAKSAAPTVAPVAVVNTAEIAAEVAAEVAELSREAAQG